MNGYHLLRVVYVLNKPYIKLIIPKSKNNLPELNNLKII